MTFTAFLQILGMAVAGAFGGVLIFQILHRIETHHKTPREQRQTSPQPAEKKSGVAMPGVIG